MTRWTEYGRVDVVEHDEDLWVVTFTSLDGEQFTLDGAYDSPGGAVDGAVMWALQRNVTLAWAGAAVRRKVAA